MKLIFHKIRETKNFAVFEEVGNSMNKLYLSKDLPETITLTISEE